VGDPPPRRLGGLELLGAWLRVWTPPRDAVIPPVPWRAIAAGTVALVVVLGAAAAFVLPRVAHERAAARERDARAAAGRHGAFLASVDREQRPRTGHARADPGPGASATRRTADRAALVAAARSGIGADAGSRTTKAIRGVECERFPRTLAGADPAADVARSAGAYDCIAVTARFGRASDPGGRGVIGMAFRLVVDFERGRFAWCRIVPLADRDRVTHPLPPACRLP
jgi:hypothetical protein